MTSLRVGEICAGYGGISLGLAAAGVTHEVAWIAEIDKALADATQPAVPNLGDITAVDWSSVPPVDLVTAGFPCQPVSAAGRQLADADERWLWPHVRNALAELRPAHFLLENVRNLVSIRKGELWAGILSDLGALGFSVRWLTLGACHVGAAHHRHRVFALATQQGHETDEVERIATSACGAKGADAVPGGRRRDSVGARNETANRSDPDSAHHSGTTLGDFAQIVGALLPTPTTRDGDGRGTGDEPSTPHRRSLGRAQGMPLDSTVALLPTPRASDGVNGGPGQRGSSGDLALPSATQPQHWGRFADAVARHEALHGPAPAPTEPNRNGAPRLSAAFAEWLMCLPAGHVTGVLDRRAALKAVGNGVCPPQLAAAFRLLADPTSPVDTSLGKDVRSHAMTTTTTTTNTEIKAIQDREADARGRVIDAGCNTLVGADHYDDAYVARAIEAAMKELAACWREQAEWWRASGKRGGKGTADELTKAAGRLTGFAVGLSTRPVNLPESNAADPINYCERCDTDMHRCPGCGDVVKHDQTACGACLATVDGAPSWLATPAPVVHPDVVACEAGGHPDDSISTLPDGRVICTRCMVTLDPASIDYAAVQEQVAILEAEREQAQSDAALILDTVGLSGDEPVGTKVTVGGIEFTKISDNPFPVTQETRAVNPVHTMVDNPFTSPTGPGSGAARSVAALPYSVLPVIAAQLEPRTQLSHSFVETYENCSLKSMLQRASRHGLVGPSRPSWSLIGGRAFHAAVEEIERDAIAHPGRVPVSSRSITANDSAVVDVDGVWNNALDASVLEAAEEVKGSVYVDMNTWHASQGGKEGYDWWRVEGALMLHRYLEFHDAAWRSTRTMLRLLPLEGVAPVPVIEHEFVASIAADAGSGTSALTTKGFIDAVWLSPEARTLDIVDWKTGSRRPTSTFQLGEYAHGLIPLLPAHLQPDSGTTIRGSYWLARKGEYTPAVPLLDRHSAAEMTYRYRQAALGSSLGIAAPNVTDMCVACGVRDYCPAQAGR